MQNERDVSKLIAYILRHRPDEFGLPMDGHGWVDADALVKAVSSRYEFDRKTLEHIVATDEKKRYSFNDDGTLIRANQGHSVQVDVGLKEVIPPDTLYHGTGRKYVDGIMSLGLLPKSRLYVHLSGDIDTAMNVGSRHGEPVVFEVNAKKMREDGHLFWISENDVWLARAVPVQYLKVKE